jgi:hypothetical protein
MIKFGFNSSDLAPLAQQLEALLGIRCEAHESDFHGGEYYRAECAQGTVRLLVNYDPVDREVFEADWPEKRAILYLDGTDDSAWTAVVERLRAASNELGASYLGKSMG